MWRWVVQDYFSVFRWEKLKDWMKSGDWFWMGYFLILMPYICGFLDKDETMIVYYIMIGPVGWMLVSEALRENVLPKIFYICPMEKKQRKGYVERKFIFAMLVPAFLGSVSAIILWGMGLCQLLTAITYWVNVVILGITTSSFYGKRKITIPENGSRKKENLYMGGVIETSNLVISLVSIFGLGMMLNEYASTEYWCKWIFVAVAVVIQLPLTIKYLSGWNKAVENAVGYAKTRL